MKNQLLSSKLKELCKVHEYTQDYVALVYQPFLFSALFNPFVHTNYAFP